MKPYVAFALAGALLFAVGNALQKEALARRLPPQGVAGALRRPRPILGALRSPAWLAGMLLTVVAVGCEMQALALGDLVVVKPLSRVQSLFALGIGVAILRERLRPGEWSGLAVLLAGVWVLGLEPSDARAYAPPPQALAVAALAVGLVAAAWVALAERSRGRLAGELGLALPSGLLFGLGDSLLKVATEGIRSRAGSFDVASAATWTQLGHSAVVFLSFAITGVAFVLQQLAFTRGRVSLVVPVIGAGGLLVALVFGCALLGESLGAGRAFGVALVAIGTLLTAGGQEPPVRWAAA